MLLPLIKVALASVCNLSDEPYSGSEPLTVSDWLKFEAHCEGSDREYHTDAAQQEWQSEFFGDIQYNEL